MIQGFNFNKLTEISSPWKLFYVDDILDQEFLKDLQTQFNLIDWDSFETYDDADLESAWGAILIQDKLRPRIGSPDLTAIIGGILGVDLSDSSIRMTFKFDTPSHTLQSPHRDSRNSIATFQIFIQENSYLDGGTIMHSGNKNTFGDPVTELPLVTNSATIFFNTPYSWHSVQQRGYFRKSLLIRYSKNNE
jgi:hypothetical protein